LTLVELVVVMGLVGILATTTSPLVFQGTRSFVFLPKAQATNQVAMEILHAIVEGSYSSLASQTVRGLRYALRQGNPVEPGIWFAQANQVGYLTSDNQRVVIRLDAEAIKRSFPASAACPPPAPSSEEVLPYYAANTIRILTPVNPLFRYYRQDQTEITPAPVCGAGLSTIRRIDIGFVAQTGSGDFDQGEAQLDVKSSVAIRFP
jgi:type II secretory pathway pseudopilin PulG